MKEALFEVIDRLSGELTALSDDIFDHPEVGYEEYRAIGLLPVFTQQPCRLEIEQDTENEQYAYADPVIDLHFQCPISSFP